MLYAVGTTVEFASAFRHPDQTINLIIPPKTKAEVIDVDPEEGLQIQLENVPPPLQSSRGIISIPPSHIFYLRRHNPEPGYWSRPYTTRQALVMTVSGVSIAVLAVIGAVAAMPQILVETAPAMRLAAQAKVISPDSAPLPLAHPPHRIVRSGI